MEEQPSYYAIIPANVRYDNRLKAQEKLMYGEITVLSNKYGYCTAGNAYFASLYEKSNETISRWITNLIHYGYVTKKVIRDKNQKVIQRQIKLSSTLPSKMTPPSPQKRDEPPLKNVKENSTSINTTSNNRTTTTAPEESQNLNEYRQAQLVYENTIGNPSPYILEAMKQWIDDLNSELVIEAIKRADINGAHNWKYVTGILKSWANLNITSVEQVKADDVEHQNKINDKYSNKHKRKPETFERGDYSKMKALADRGINPL